MLLLSRTLCEQGHHTALSDVVHSEVLTDMVERECTLCVELGTDLQDTFTHSSTLPTRLTSSCACGRAEFHSQNLLGRFKGSTTLSFL